MTTTKLATKNPQEIFVGRGMKTIAVYGSAAGQIAVHEDLTHGENFKGTSAAASRYFLSVDGKLRKEDALHDFGGGYWWGITKAEATRAAVSLVEKVNSCAIRLDNARKSTLRGADVMIKQGETQWEKLVGKYNSTVEI